MFIYFTTYMKTSKQTIIKRKEDSTYEKYHLYRLESNAVLHADPIFDHHPC